MNLLHPMSEIMTPNPVTVSPDDQLIKIDVDPEVEYLNASVTTSILSFWLKKVPGKRGARYEIKKVPGTKW